MILFHNTMQITDGHLDGFERAVREAVAFVEEHGPQVMVQVFIDRERMLAHSFQLYRDSESVLVHWRLSDPYIQGVMEHCTVRSFEVYGEPDDEVRAGLDRMLADGVPLTITPHLTGFARFPTS